MKNKISLILLGPIYSTIGDDICLTLAIQHSLLIGYLPTLLLVSVYIEYDTFRYINRPCVYHAAHPLLFFSISYKIERLE